MMLALEPVTLQDEIPAAMQPQAVELAYNRIAPYIHRTPILSSARLNEKLEHELYFKVEGFQKTGAFKARGALNTLLALKEKGQLPKEVVTFSSGNHSQGVAYAAKMLGVKATVFLTEYTSKIKQQATRGYGAEVILTKNRGDAERLTAEKAAQGAYFIHPFDHDDIIAGQGTACYEALKLDGVEPDAIFATCGGGGLLSGTYLAATLLKPNTPVFAAEPLQANDAATSYRTGMIHRFSDAPPTLADGARSMCVSPRTFQYLQKLAGFYEVDEEQMLYWTQMLFHLLKTTVEPTSAVAMGGAHQWLQSKPEGQKILVILSGGNIAPESYREIWEKDWLEKGFFYSHAT